jgi:hypothetical protein
VAQLEDLTRNAAVRGILPDSLITVVDVQFPEGDAFAVGEERAVYSAPPGCVVRYVGHPFTRESDFGTTSVNYSRRELWGRGEEPR